MQLIYGLIAAIAIAVGVFQVASLTAAVLVGFGVFVFFFGIFMMMYQLVQNSTVQHRIIMDEVRIQARKRG